jgi:hypothetical protein
MEMEVVGSPKTRYHNSQDSIIIVTCVKSLNIKIILYLYNKENVGMAFKPVYKESLICINYILITDIFIVVY